MAYHKSYKEVPMYLERHASAHNVDPTQYVVSDQGLHSAAFLDTSTGSKEWTCWNFGRSLVMEIGVCLFNPCPAEPGYVLPLQTV